MAHLVPIYDQVKNLTVSCKRAYSRNRYSKCASSAGMAHTEHNIKSAHLLQEWLILSRILKVHTFCSIQSAHLLQEWLVLGCIRALESVHFLVESALDSVCLGLEPLQSLDAPLHHLRQAARQHPSKALQHKLPHDTLF